MGTKEKQASSLFWDMTQRFRDTGRRQPRCSDWFFHWLVVMRLLKHKEEQFSHRTLHSQKEEKGVKTEAGRGDSTETKLGPSEMKEKKEVGGKTGRLKERGSVQVMDTQRQREKQRERERTCPQRI